MDGGADPFILWHKNESGGRNGEGGGRGTEKVFSRRRCGEIWMVSPRPAEENFLIRNLAVRNGRMRVGRGETEEDISRPTAGAYRLQAIAEAVWASCC